MSLRPWISKDKDNNNNICLFFRFNAEETLRRQKENRDKRKVSVLFLSAQSLLCIESKK